jgi:hypothetical protein
MAGRWFSPGTPVSSTNKIDHDDIAKILLKVALNTITLLWGFRNETSTILKINTNLHSLPMSIVFNMQTNS